ncbi:PrgH/EprH family type III secretion apparatus protein [Mixta mediterraneensis]|uniref:PrgH/EprH family type III secretion apparatus protein n=1 Tax=Mixta mediterraneensis TaxID=2758443 RepID=UPI0018767F4C|nr:PrgH/EprH family type III secretion apparatus protein [Mixta mediterraneensis]
MYIAAERYTLRILSGPMYGVDLTLPEAELLYICFADTDKFPTQSQKNNFTDAYLHADNSIFIPAPRNMEERFILRFSNSSTRTGGDALEFIEENPLSENNSSILAQRLATITTENSGACESEDIPVAFNEPVTIGCMTLAIKNVSTTWSDRVLNYASNNIAAEQQNMEENEAKRSSLLSGCKRWMLVAIAAIVVLAIIGASIGYPVSHRDRTTSLYEVLKEVAPTIVKMSNNRYYIIVDNAQKKSWVYNALRKQHLLDEKVEIVYTDKIVENIKSALRQKSVPFFNVQLTDDANITITISRERWPDNQSSNNILNTILHQEAGWANSINIRRKSDKELQTKAEEIITSSGLISQRDNGGQYINYIIRGDIDDSHMLAFRRQINEFYQQDGDEYIKFIMVLNEDPLRDQSLKTGQNGYILTPGNHWLYSDITINANQRNTL